MNFEFQEFYPITEKNRGKASKDLLGTVHLYAIEAKLDLRGIKVVRTGKKIYFFPPQIFGKDHETGEGVRYPVYRFTDPDVHQAMLDFLHKTVKPIVLERLNGPKTNRSGPKLNDLNKHVSKGGFKKITSKNGK